MAPALLTSSSASSSSPPSASPHATPAPAHSATLTELRRLEPEWAARTTAAVEALCELCLHPLFPEEEFEILRAKRKQRAIVDSGRVGLIAQKSFLRNLFGEGHPYSPVASPEYYDTISLEGVKSHFNKYYLPDRMAVTASGFIDAEVVT